MADESDGRYWDFEPGMFWFGLIALAIAGPLILCIICGVGLCAENGGTANSAANSARNCCSTMFSWLCCCCQDGIDATTNEIKKARVRTETTTRASDKQGWCSGWCGGWCDTGGTCSTILTCNRCCGWVEAAEDNAHASRPAQADKPKRRTLGQIAQPLERSSSSLAANPDVDLDALSIEMPLLAFNAHVVKAYPVDCGMVRI